MIDSRDRYGSGFDRQRALLNVARERGEIVATSRDIFRQIGEGGEHHVELSVDGARVIKHTKDGRFGFIPDVDGEGHIILRSATAPEYLERTDLCERLFPLEARVEGSHAEAGGGFTVSYRHFAGASPPSSRVEQFMAELGFTKVDDAIIYHRTLEHTTWHHAATGILVGDAKPDNFRLTQSGEVVPVDLMLRRAPLGSVIRQAIMKAIQ